MLNVKTILELDTKKKDLSPLSYDYHCYHYTHTMIVVKQEMENLTQDGNILLENNQEMMIIHFCTIMDRPVMSIVYPIYFGLVNNNEAVY